MKGMFLKKCDICYEKWATVVQIFQLSLTKLGTHDAIRWFDGIFISFFKDKKSKRSHNSRNQGFSYYFCLMIKGSGSGSRPLTDISGSGSTRPKNMCIRWLRIRIWIQINKTIRLKIRYSKITFQHPHPDPSVTIKVRTRRYVTCVKDSRYRYPVSKNKYGIEKVRSVRYPFL